MLSTAPKKTTLSPDQKKAKIESARLYHSTLLKDNNVPDMDFNVKLAFYDKSTGTARKIVGLFPNELVKSNGFYFELVDSNLEPIDEKRTIYKFPCTENYEDVYTVLPKGAYAVPLTDLEEVKPKIVGELNPHFVVEKEIIDEAGDAPFSKMTIKDIAAILWKEPVSEKKWLNDLINENQVQQY